MKVAESRVTAQGQISVPAEVRRLLGLAPGTIIEWDAEGDTIVVRRARRYTSADVHQMLFPDAPSDTPARARSLSELKDGIRKHMLERHARR